MNTAVWYTLSADLPVGEMLAHFQDYLTWIVVCAWCVAHTLPIIQGPPRVPDGHFSIFSFLRCCACCWILLSLPLSWIIFQWWNDEYPFITCSIHLSAGRDPLRRIGLWNLVSSPHLGRGVGPLKNLKSEGDWLVDCMTILSLSFSVHAHILIQYQ